MSRPPIVIPPGFRVLTVPGLYGSGPGHWQSRWEALHPDWQRVEQKDWSQPSLHLWAERVGAAVAQARQARSDGAGGAGKVLLLAHSFGCLASLRHVLDSALEDPAHIAGMLLVAPADPEKFGVGPLLPQGPLPFPTIVAASRNDPWVPQPVAFDWATVWGSEKIDLGIAGHVNADSGLGDWPLGLSLVERLVQRIVASGARPEPEAQSAWQRDVDLIGPIPYM
ncbi:RBBP9/YdeN family alpha/beta hydrolase [Imbroritus primus]|uniref:RBBP9/YdeN family alpha/beta hydrolase n=1 Tax=Imbroritus primus TaxID=3058603 RepID=UPI003D161723